MTGQPRFRLLLAATVVLLGLVLVTSRCGGAEGDSDGSGGEASPAAATGATVPTPPGDSPGAADAGDPGDPAGAAPDSAAPADAGGATTAEQGPTTLAPRPGDSDAPLADPAATGRELAQRFLDILARRDPRAALEEFLSPSFQLQRANGTFADREEYLDAPAVVGRATILTEGFRAYQDGSVLTVRFTVDIEETVSGQAGQVRRADRLAVFRRGADGWKVVAWANFNPA
jgi:hypothetical protein